MGEFVSATLSFPPVLFSFLLVLVIAYWLLVILGGVEVDSLDGDVDVDLDADSDGGGVAGLVSSLGLRGVPVTVTFSLLIILAWFFSVTGTILLDDVPGWPVFSVLVLAAAVFCAWAGTRVLIVPASRLFPEDTSPTRADFVGSSCVIRTRTVSADFGQAEITSPDGSSAIINVRQHPGEEALADGDAALIFDYDAERELFWVTPDPNRLPTSTEEPPK